jgi:DNA-directed RNA polymerase subunit RPC12/RpoP
MPTIDCPECGKQVSDQSVACPNCGYPIAHKPSTERPSQPPAVRQAKTLGIILGIILFIPILIFVFIPLWISVWQLVTGGTTDPSEFEHKRQAESQRIHLTTDATAERERVRHFSPEGTAYSLKRIAVPIPGGLAAILPGDEVKVIKNSDGTLHIQKGDLAADVPSSAITNDRDVAAELRSNEKNDEDAFQQWRAQQAAIAAEHEKQRYLQPTPTPNY